MNIASLLIKTSKLYPNRWAIALGSEFNSTYLDKANRVARLAGGLKDRVKVKAGHRVALAMNNCVEYSDILFASWHIGAITVPMNAKLHAKEFAYSIEDSGARICFVTEDLFEAIQGSIRSLSDPPQVIVVGSQKYVGL
ncbi:MAG: 2-succinylbenzoate--CoA ligase, partial [Alphaproteobacteria bacterium MarineAlpha3_Bin7]